LIRNVSKIVLCQLSHDFTSGIIITRLIYILLLLFLYALTLLMITENLSNRQLIASFYEEITLLIKQKNARTLQIFLECHAHFISSIYAILPSFYQSDLSLLHLVYPSY